MVGRKKILRLKWFEKIFGNLLPIKKSDHDINTDLMKITDINIDCLESIFNYLPLSDLLNVSDSNKYLKKAAALVFVQKYRKKTMQLNGLQMSQSRKILINSRIYIRDLRTALQILRCFGYLISKLEISDEYSHYYRTHVYIYIFKYIYKFCKSLTTIKFQELPRNKAFKYLRKPFRKVKSVEFSCGVLEENLTSLNILFPNIVSLKIDFCDVKNLRCIEQHFVHLQHLELGTSKENIQTVVSLNPNLKHFSTHTICDMQTIQKFSKLQLLESLSIVCSSDEFTQFNGLPLNFKTVKKLKLQFSHVKNQFPKIPLIFDQLNEFSTNHRMDAEFYEFIAKHSAITKLNLPSSGSSKKNIEEKQLEFLKMMHLLKELNLSHYAFSIDQAIRIFDEFKTLNKFGFSIISEDEYTHLVKRSKDGWSVTKGKCIFHPHYAELRRNF